MYIRRSGTVLYTPIAPTRACNLRRALNIGGGQDRKLPNEKSFGSKADKMLERCLFAVSFHSGRFSKRRCQTIRKYLLEHVASWYQPLSMTKTERNETKQNDLAGGCEVHGRDPRMKQICTTDLADGGAPITMRRQLAASRSSADPRTPPDIANLCRWSRYGRSSSNCCKV